MDLRLARECSEGLLPALSILFDTTDSKLSRAALDTAARAASLSSRAIASHEGGDGGSEEEEEGMRKAAASAMHTTAKLHILSRVLPPLLAATAAAAGLSTAPSSTTSKRASRDSASPLSTLSPTATLTTSSSAVPALLLQLLGAIAHATDNFGELLESTYLSPLLLVVIDRKAHEASMLPEALHLLRSLAERPACLLSLGWLPLLRGLLSRMVSLPPQRAESLLDSLYLTLCFVRQVVQAAAAGAGGGEVGSEKASTNGGGGADQAERLLNGLAPLLTDGIHTLMRMLLSPSARLADRAAHTLSLLAQLLSPSRPHECCRALLVSSGAPGTLLSLFDQPDRPTVQQRAIKAMKWLRAADEDEFNAALAANPQLEHAFSTRAGGERPPSA